MSSTTIKEVLNKTVKSVYIDDEIEKEVRDAIEVNYCYRAPLVAIYFCDGGKIVFFHEKDCCEKVRLEDVSGGSLSDLVGNEILDCYESEGEIGNDEYGRFMFTFYVIRTENRTLTLRFLGESNGYYSEEVEWVFL
jgi:hypothetical protein